MKMTFIGCGDSFADFLGNNSALLEWGNTNLLIDIPDSNYGRMKHMNMEYSDIDHIFITHLHGDHINGLERFAYYRTFATPVVRPNENIGKAHLWVPETLYEGLWQSVKSGLGVTANGAKTLEDYFHVHLIAIDSTHPLYAGAFTINETTFHLVRSHHVPGMDCFGLLVENHFYYSADNTYRGDDFMKDICNKVSKAFHDIHYFDSTIAVHASVRDFSKLPNEYKEKIAAMHYDDSKKDTQSVDGIQLVKPYQPIDI